MSNIEIISASAGSGKTYTLAKLVEEEITAGQVRPDAVLATTFTNKAAAELRERARRTLTQANRIDDAQRLRASRIGTVNAVCGRLVGDFAFELGLSPDVRVLDETLAAATFAEALASVRDETTTAALAELTTRMPEFDPGAAVRQVVERARTNGLAAEQLSACADRSVAEFSTLFGAPAGSARELDEALAVALHGFVAAVDVAVDPTGVTAAALELAGTAVRDLARDGFLPWSRWAQLTRLGPGKKSDGLADPVRRAAAAQDVHPRLHADVESAIRHVYTLSSAALSAYQAHKRAWGVLDFADQEVLALKLLGREDVRAQLREELDLVVVDEFQDTSPVQLAIFLELSRIVPRSVWVGDQKQAIYGFRGADPALMDAVILTLLGDTEPRTLPKSYRSRPELVRLTSELFAAAFPAQGIPESRVRLVPAIDTEPPQLGAIVEAWSLATKRIEDDAQAVAAGVHALLDDPAVRVRDGAGASRAVRAGDIAVLCRRNVDCGNVAAAIAALGLHAALPGAGLLGTAEAQAAFAALRLFVDGRDALAIAELARIHHADGDPDVWLAQLLAAPYAAEFAGLPVILRLAEARAAAPTAGALAAFDLALEAAEVAELCRRWGDSDARLANLERLRAHVVSWLAGIAQTGGAATPAGLVAWLGHLAGSGEDASAVRTGVDAVVVSTFHAAKGLEWPVVVLYHPSRPAGSALGVRVVSDEPEFDLGAPLAGRWVRYWPQPYLGAQKRLPFHTRLAAHPATAAADAQEARQSLRLLYVGWTRARDRLVLTSRPEKLNDGLFGLLESGGTPLLTEPGPDAVWAGRPVNVTVRELVPLAPVATPSHPGQGFDRAGPQQHPPAFRRPSSFEEMGTLVAHERLGPHLTLTGEPEMSALGEAVHGFLAADRPELAPEHRLRLAEELLVRWAVAGALPPAELLAAADRLRAWVERRWPGARWCREWPLAHRLVDGSEVRGSSDLVLDTLGGFVVVDHKSTPGSTASAIEGARAHAGQLRTYATAIFAATGRPVVGWVVHLPVAGLVVEIGAPAGP